MNGDNKHTFIELFLEEIAEDYEDVYGKEVDLEYWEENEKFCEFADTWSK